MSRSEMADVQNELYTYHKILYPDAHANENHEVDRNMLIESIEETIKKL